MPSQVLSDKFCRDLPHPEKGQKFYFDDHKDAPPGFAMRVTAGAKSWVLTYYARGVQRRVTLPVGFPAWGPARARKEASSLRLQIQSGADPLAERAREVKAAKERKTKDMRTLGALLTAYADHLDALGKPSAREVGLELRNHVELAHPKLWRKPVHEVEPEDGVAILATLVEAGKMRQAGKVRSYMRTAFAVAVRARLDASASAALRALGIRSNPFSDLPTLEGGTGNTRDRALSVEELRAYWRRIEAMPDADGALLRFHLLTGCQRAEQLARATTDDRDPDTQTLLLRDTKGRRTKPRRHVVPLIDTASDALDAMRGRGEFVVSIDGGKSGAAYYALQHRVRKVSDAMAEAGEVVTPFTPGDLRRTVETRLAALGVSKETRAHLQSHGLGGVQDRHYDKHERLDEKREALEALHRLLTGAGATVTPIRKKSGASR